MSDYSEILALIDDDLINMVKVGTSINLDSAIDDRKVIIAATHCVLNGPVGVHKETTFPGISEEITISDLFTDRISNRTWRNFCRVVATQIDNINSDLECQSKTLFGSLWPISETRIV